MLKAQVIPAFSPHFKTNLDLREKIKKGLLKKKKQVIFFSKHEEFSSFVKQEKPKQQIRLTKTGSDIPKNSYLDKEKIYLKAYTLKERPVKKLNNKKIGIVKFTDDNTVLRSIIEKYKVSIKQLRTVSKEENLIPLLFFKNVDLIFLDSRSTSFLNRQFNIELKELKWNPNWGGEALIRSGTK